jgi:hypothetical protein
MNITLNCELEKYLIESYEKLMDRYCYNSEIIENSESCIKLMYNIWITKLNYNRFCIE